MEKDRIEMCPDVELNRFSSNGRSFNAGNVAANLASVNAPSRKNILPKQTKEEIAAAAVVGGLPTMENAVAAASTDYNWGMIALVAVIIILIIVIVWIVFKYTEIHETVKNMMRPNLIPYSRPIHPQQHLQQQLQLQQQQQIPIATATSSAESMPSAEELESIRKQLQANMNEVKNLSSNQPTEPSTAKVTEVTSEQQNYDQIQNIQDSAADVSLEEKLKAGIEDDEC